MRVLTLTNKAISLLENNLIDDALAVIENRERALSLISSGKTNLTQEDYQILRDIAPLNDQLLTKLQEARKNVKEEISQTQKNSEAHKAYHSGQVK